MLKISCQLEEPKNLPAYIALSAAHDISCREQETHAATAELLRINSKFILYGVKEITV